MAHAIHQVALPFVTCLPLAGDPRDDRPDPLERATLSFSQRGTVDELSGEGWNTIRIAIL